MLGHTFKPLDLLKNANTNRVFADETMILHLWIISRSLGMNDRKILDELHNHAHGLTNIRDRYVLYDRESAKDMELLRQNLTPMGLAKAFLQCVGNKEPDSNLLFVETAAIQRVEIFDAFKSIKQKRGEVKIR